MEGLIPQLEGGSFSMLRHVSSLCDTIHDGGCNKSTLVEGVGLPQHPILVREGWTLIIVWLFGVKCGRLGLHSNNVGSDLLWLTLII